MPIKCQLVTKTSKSGNEYQCLEIYITESYKKIVLLERAELELLKQISNTKQVNH